MNLIELIEQNRRRNADLAAQGASASTVAPDLLGRAIESAPLTGAAPSMALQDPGGFQRLYQDRMNAGALRAGQITATWMNGAPENAALISDEIPNIINWERTAERIIRRTVSPSSFTAGLESALLGIYRDLPGVRLIPGVDSPAEQAAAEQTRSELGIEYLGTLQRLERELADTGVLDRGAVERLTSNMSPALAARAFRYASMPPDERAEERARIANVVSLSQVNLATVRQEFERFAEAQNLLATGRTINFTDIRDVRSAADWFSFMSGSAGADVAAAWTTMLAGGVIGGPLGARAAVAEYGYARAFGQITSGQLLGDAPYTTEAILRARLFSAASAGVEVLLPSAARRTTGLVRNAYSQVSREVMERTAIGYSRRIGRAFIGDAVEEFFQEGAQYFLEKAGVEGEDFRWTDETLLEAFNAAMGGLVGGGIIGGGLGARQAIVAERIARELRDAGQTVQNMEELANVTQDLQLATRSPTKFQQLAQRLGLNKVPVFYQAEDLNTYFQSQNKDPVTEVVKLGATAEDFEAALASGGRVAVTAEGLARAGLRGTDGDFLTESGSFTSAGSTPAEAKAVEQTYNEIQQQIQEQSRMAEMAPERRQVYDAIYGQLRRAGRSQREAEANAALSTAFFETMAARYGDDSGLDLYRRFGFRVEGPRQMVRAEAAAEAAQLQIPDETVAIINDAITQAQAGGPVTLPITPEVALALQTLGVPVDPSGTISAEDAQRLTAALQALEDVIAPAAAGPTFMQAPLDAAQRLDIRGPVRSPRGSTYMGVGAQYTVENPNTEAPALQRNAPLIQASTNATNADAQSAALDVLFERHPDPLSSEEAWVNLANDAFSLDRVPMPPFRTIAIVQQGPAAVAQEISQLSDGMRRDAEAGLQTAREFGEVYANGEATPTSPPLIL